MLIHTVEIGIYRQFDSMKIFRVHGHVLKRNKAKLSSVLLILGNESTPEEINQALE